MDIDSILVPKRTFANVETSSKKRAIERAATLIADAEADFDAADLYGALIAREKLGPTAIGNGIAIPHCRLGNCHTIVGGLFRLTESIDFEAYDDEPVSIMFVLLVPQNETQDHLNTLAMLAKRFESAPYREGLMMAKDSQELYEMALREPEEAARSAL